MTRSPLRGTPRRSHDDDDASARSQTKEVISLAKAVNDRLVIPQGPPHTEEEKRATYLALARLKAQRFTREECAAALGVSVSSVARYLADPLYEEVRTDLMAESKSRGHLLISETGIVNFLVIAELFLLDAKGKWGMSPNAARRNRHEKL